MPRFVAVRFSRCVHDAALSIEGRGPDGPLSYGRRPPVSAAPSTAPRRELVEAGAGCGKTESLVTRYIEALGYDARSGAPLRGVSRTRPGQIIALTFTEDAAA